MAYRVGQQLGNYRLVRQLGRGAFADVYLGEHRYLKSKAALKCFVYLLQTKTRNVSSLKRRHWFA